MTSIFSPPISNDSILAQHVLQELIRKGVSEFCLCPGARNAPLVYPLMHAPSLSIYSWPEERSAAFFALGRIKATGRPVAIVTTSGTAVAEILPATMEAYYMGLPLVLVTADRPRRFRGTGAPQSAEQVGLFGPYVYELQDLMVGDICCLDQWDYQGPIHLNVCFEEPRDSICQSIRLDNNLLPTRFTPSYLPFYPDERYLSFLEQTRFPLVVVGALTPTQRESAIQFLLHLQAPIYAEGISGIREDPRLISLRITHIESIWQLSAKYQYPIDGILRLGSIPTVRLWRDLEEKAEQVNVCSISEQPFSGLSWMGVIHTSLEEFFKWAQTIKIPNDYPYQHWQRADLKAQQVLLALFKEEPHAEPSLIHTLSQRILRGSKIYLGNSLPIREWDLAATREPKDFQLAANRGVNGIDGQLSTFLGYSTKEQENWAILGDLTALYDLIAPWITSQISPISCQVVIINNGGGEIFKHMFTHPAFQNTHQISFKPLAALWKWDYEKWTSIPHSLKPHSGGKFIELIPDLEANERFWQRLKNIRVCS